MNFLFIYLGEKGRGCTVHVYVWEHIVSLNLVGISTNDPAHFYWLLGQIRPGADPGQGHNRSMRAPSPKSFFFRPEGYSNKPNAEQLFRSIWEEVFLFLVPFESQIFDVFLKSFWCILMQISMGLYAVKSFICINFV